MVAKRTRKPAPAAPSPAASTIVTSRMPVTGDSDFGWAKGGPYMPRAGTAYRDAAPTVNAGRGVSFRLTSANKDIIRERRQAVVNAREVDRNNAMIHAGISKRAVDMVGPALRLMSMPNFEALGLTDEWAQGFANEWENQFSLFGDAPRKLYDAARHDTFGAQMLSTVRNTYGADGEAALIVRYSEERMKRYRGRFASFVEQLDPDRITNPDAKIDSETLCQGRVLDEWGAYTGFHVETRHPSDPLGKKKWEFIPRETARGRPIGIHWFPKFRAGAQRAMPAIIGALREVRMLDTFDQKTLEQAVKAAFMSIYIKTDATAAEALSKLQVSAPSGSGAAADLIKMQDARFGLYEDLNVEGQSLPMLAMGDEIGIAEATHARNDTDSFRFAFDRKFASLLGLSYARFSNDYSKTSFASIRAELIDAWRLTYCDRYQFCESVPSQIALAHLEECIVRRKIILPANAPYFYDHMEEYAQCEFRGPGMGWVDPVKDVTGASIRVSTGFSTPQAEAASQGSDFYDNIDGIARAQAYAKRKGVKVTYGQANQQQTPDENADQNVDEEGNPVEPPSGKLPAPAPQKEDA